MAFQKIVAPFRKYSIILPILLLIIGIGVIEFIIMQFLPLLQKLLPSWPEALLDAVVLAISIAPLVYLVIRKHLITQSVEQSRIKTKLFIVSGVPLTISIVLMGNIVFSKQEQINTLEVTSSVIQFDIALGKFVDLYSNELELSMRYLIDPQDPQLTILLKSARENVSKALPPLVKNVLVDHINAGNFSRQYTDNFKATILNLRNDVDDQTISWLNVVDVFVKSNADFLSRLDAFSDQIENREVAQRHANYLTMIKLKTIQNISRVVLLAAQLQERVDDNKVALAPIKQLIRLKNSQADIYLEIFKSTIVERDVASIGELLDAPVIEEAKESTILLEQRRVEQLVANLKGAIGYNGLIHQFKNYVLRNKESDRLKFIALYDTVIKIVNELNTLLSSNTKAIQHLASFSKVIDEYRDNLFAAQHYHQQKLGIKQIDKMVAINDQPAYSALSYLRNNVWEFDSNKTLTLLTEQRQIFHDIELQLHKKLVTLVDHLLLDKKQDTYSTAIIALVLMVFVIALLIKITRHISLSYQQRIEAMDAANEAAQMKSEFLANMSHEIRTPMNGVLGMLGLLSSSSLSDEQAHKVTVAKSSAESLLTLINDILDFSKVDAGKLELEYLDFNLRTMMGEVAESMALAAQEKNIELILDLTHVEHSMIKSDPSRLRQILTNIIGNAIKFTDDGEIVIAVKLQTIPDTQTHKLTCQISDTGIGISVDKIDSLFDAFNQVDASTTRKYGGTGLGLSITKKLCQLMEGDISVTSEQGNGSCFTFHLIVEQSEKSIPVIPNIDINKLSVLVVDDNATNREVIRNQLANWGASVIEADSGASALNILSEHLKDDSLNLFDVAIIDMQMPNMNGATLAKKIRANDQFEDLKMIMMTSMGERGDAKQFAELGFSGYFPKPTTTEDLIRALAVVVDNGAALHQAVPLVTHHYVQSAETIIDCAPPKAEISSSQSISILLVEDNRVNQMVAQGVLKQLGYSADIAVNGEEAINALNNPPNDNPYSLVLMDCQMPVMDGYEATKRIREGAAGDNNKAITIVAMTANAMQGDKEKCLNAGMDDYISKPISPEKVKTIIVSSMASRTALD